MRLPRKAAEAKEGERNAKDAKEREGEGTEPQMDADGRGTGCLRGLGGRLAARALRALGSAA